MAEAESPKKHPHLETADDERSSDTDDQNHPSKESEDDTTMLASEPSSEPWQRWTIEQVAEQLSNRGIPEDAVQKFRDHKIDGSVLSRLTLEHISNKLNIQELGTQLKIQTFLQSLGIEDFDNLHPDGSKVFNDPVHGHMEFHPLLVAIIDTPQFQRLRYLKQLGGCYFVYPGAAHNRFEHCLGVCHLAGELVKALQKRQPRLGITDKDALCVQIAGLCHDLGHGPFSHLYDKFIPYIRKDKKWEHEEASVAMFDYMVGLEANQLKAVFEKYDMTDEDQVCIKEQILGKPLTRRTEGAESEWRYGPEKAFLYEIVANKRNGVDVDKWDYFKRDCLHLGMTSSFDHQRFIKFARVIRVEGELQICVRDKEAFNMYQMFHTRHALHRKAYQHKAVQAVEIMLVEAMKEADKFIKIPGENGNCYDMSDCIDHMDAFTNLTDNIFHLILLNVTEDEPVKRAQEILGDIQRRKLYKCVGESVPVSGAGTMEKNVETINKELLQELSQHEAEVQEQELDPSRIVVQIVNLDFGKKDQNPVDDIRFFSKNNLNNAVPVKASEVSSLLPQVFFKERLVRVFLRPTTNEDADKQCIELLQQAFKRWCSKNSMKKPEESTKLTVTPAKSDEPLQDVNMTPPQPIQTTKKPHSAMKAKQELSFQ